MSPMLLPLVLLVPQYPFGIHQVVHVRLERQPIALESDSSLSRLSADLRAAMHGPKCFQWSSVQLERQFDTKRMFASCVSRDSSGSKSYSYGHPNRGMVVIGRQIRVEPDRLFSLADSLDEAFGAGRICTLDPFWEGPTIKRYRQWEVDGHTVQMHTDVQNDFGGGGAHVPLRRDRSGPRARRL